MAQSIEINKPIQTFDDHTDFSRNNPDRQKWGEHKNAEKLNMASENWEGTPVERQPVQPAPVPPTETPKPKFTHKLSNGTVLEAESVDALASLIEKSFAQPQTPPAPVEFDDKPLYQPVQFQRKELTLQQQADILNIWKENPQKAMRMLQEAEFGASIETIMQNLSRAEVRELNRAEETAGVEFLMENDTYNPTKDNADKLTKFLREKQKPITKKNLTIAFQQLSANDPAMIRKVEAPPAEPTEELEAAPPPPTVVPSNQGRPEPPKEPGVDIEAFKRLSLKEQQAYFAANRRRVQ